MNNDYFEQIISRLAIEEFAILGILFDKDATASFKAIRRNQLFEDSDLTTALFRKAMDKLTATNLISVVTGGKEHKVFLTTYGVQAVDQSLEEA